MGLAYLRLEVENEFFKDIYRLSTLVQDEGLSSLKLLNQLGFGLCGTGTLGLDGDATEKFSDERGEAIRTSVGFDFISFSVDGKKGIGTYNLLRVDITESFLLNDSFDLPSKYPA